MEEAVAVTGYHGQLPTKLAKPGRHLPLRLGQSDNLVSGRVAGKQSRRLHFDNAGFARR